MSHKSVIQHFEVSEKNIRNRIEDSIPIFNNMVRTHCAWIFFRINSFTHKKTGSYFILEARVIPYCLGQTFGLIAGKCIHRIHDNNLYTCLAFILITMVTVIQNRIQEALCLTRARTCCKKCGFRTMTVLHAKLPKSL